LTKFNVCWFFYYWIWFNLSNGDFAQLLSLVVIEMHTGILMLTYAFLSRKQLDDTSQKQ